MRTLFIFLLAAFAFSVLAGGIEALWERRAQQRLHEKSLVVLHRLARPRFRRVRHPRSERALHHVGLFFGFLLATYIGSLLLKIAHKIIAQWF